MIEKWVNFKRDYLEISFLRENWVCATSPYHRRNVIYYQCSSLLLLMVWRYKRQYTNKH